MGCHSLFQETLLTQGSNPCLLISCMGKWVLYNKRSATWEAHKMLLRGIHLPTSALIHVIQFSHAVVSNSLQPLDWSIPGFPVHHQSLELAKTHVHRDIDAIQLSHPLSSPSPPAFNLSQHQGLFQGVSSSHQVAKVLEFSFSISPSNKYSGLIFFRIDWFDLFAVQGILKSFLQHHSSKASVLQHSAFFIVQLSHP